MGAWCAGLALTTAVAALAAGRLGAGTDPVLRVVPVRVLVAAPTGAAPRAQPGVTASPEWVSRTAAAAGIPWPAMRAYADASVRMARSRPACHLSWTTLAGIGWVESQHGTIGGRELSPDGRPGRKVVGPPLDGSAGLATLPALPQWTARDGTRWQQAEGPLQFLPSTWRRWRADGDGDGTTDVDDLDDAALAAARYLCSGGADLASGPGWTGAVLSYNHSVVYVNDVHAAAQTYADRTS